MNPEFINLEAEFKGLDNREKFELYRKLWHRAGSYNLLTSFPLHLDIELAGICNLKCKNCFQNGLIDGPLGLMDKDVFKEIIIDGAAKGLCAIKLQIRGESFLHPAIFECIEFAKKQGVLDIQITTNGTLLDKDNIKQILNSGLDAIIFSVDNHHAVNFTKKNSYSTTEKAISALLKLREQSQQKKPWVRIQSSIPVMDKKSFTHAKNYIKEKFPLADIHVIHRIHDFRDDHDAYPDLRTSYNLLPCSYLMQRLAIFWNGDVTVCCSDYNNSFQLGSILNNTIQNIWHSPILKKFRDIHGAGNRKTMKICRHCPADIQLKQNSELVHENTKCHLNDC